MLLEKIKERIAQEGSPIRTVKGVIDAIDMSEPGFYRMIKRGSTKYGTIISIANVLDVEPTYLSDNILQPHAMIKMTEKNRSSSEYAPTSGDTYGSMEEFMQKVKQRIAERDCPIKSLKSLSKAIEMSEGGFYMMFNRGTMKLRTKQAICEALQVPQNYFDKPEPNSSESTANYHESANTLESVAHNVQEIKAVFEEQLRAKEEQLRAKDRQIEKLLDLLGKPKGAIVEPLRPGMGSFESLLSRYRGTVLGQIETHHFFLAQPVAKLVAPRCLM